ncbi:CheR family methyltransferase [Sulfurimonas sp.]
MDSKIELSLHELHKLADFLHKNTGIFMEEQKRLRFKRKIEDIFTKHDIDNFNHFYHQLRFVHNEELLQDLINAVTVNETYFWREHEQFRILTKEILPQMVTPHSLRHIRILVAPCSSGEEIYSIMLSILDAEDLLEKFNIEIVGIDIDSNMIQKAKKGLYTQRSVEKLPLHLLHRYFKKIGEFYQFDQELINMVQLKKLNIFEDGIVKKIGTFDIIFSRNMLIYFNKENKQHAFETFYILLKNNGYLFLGHADVNGLDKRLFQTTPYRFQVFQKKFAIA